MLKESSSGQGCDRHLFGLKLVIQMFHLHNNSKKTIAKTLTNQFKNKSKKKKILITKALMVMKQNRKKRKERKRKKGQNQKNNKKQ